MGYNKNLQLKLLGIAVVNGKYIKQVGHFVMNDSSPWSYNCKSLSVPSDYKCSLGKPIFAEFRVTTISVRCFSKTARKKSKD